MDRQPRLTDDRVRIRPLCEEDREVLFRIASDKRVWEQHPIHDRWQPEVYAAFFDEAMREGGALAIFDQTSGHLAGSSQFRPTPFDLGAIEIGWTFLAPEYWGTGLNHAAKRLMLTHALAHYPRVLFRVGEDNRRSRKAMERIGGQLTDLAEDGVYQGRALRHVVYEITRDSFAAGPLAGEASAYTKDLPGVSDGSTDVG